MIVHISGTTWREIQLQMCALCVERRKMKAEKVQDHYVLILSKEELIKLRKIVGHEPYDGALCTEIYDLDKKYSELKYDVWK